MPAAPVPRAAGLFACGPSSQGRRSLSLRPLLPGPPVSLPVAPVPRAAGFFAWRPLGRTGGEAGEGRVMAPGAARKAQGGSPKGGRQTSLAAFVQQRVR